MRVDTIAAPGPDVPALQLRGDTLRLIMLVNGRPDTTAGVFAADTVYLLVRGKRVPAPPAAARALRNMLEVEGTDRALRGIVPPRR